ncbi:MAG: acyltransferase [Candidatus Micrarchaeota archaeon]
MRKLTPIPKARALDANSLVGWWRVRHPLRVFLNFWVIEAGSYSPSLRLKNVLYRAIGVKIGHGARIAPGVVLDFFWPELIEIGQGALIGYGATVLAHEFLADECRTGPVRIGKRSLIGANSTVLAGVSVGEGAQVSAMSLVNSDIPAHCLAGGVPAKVIRKLKRN